MKTLGAEFFARYESVRVLAGGRSGASVRLVRGREDGREYVLKTDLCPAMAAEMAFDATAVGPAFVKVRALGDAGCDAPALGVRRGACLVLFDHVDGRPMHEFLRACSPADCAAVLFQLGHALHTLHVRFGVEHCDLHSNNILVSRHARTSRRFRVGDVSFRLHRAPLLKIIDFGLVGRPGATAGRSYLRLMLKLYQVRLSSRALVGTRLRMTYDGKGVSPEIWRYMTRDLHPGCINHRSDIEEFLAIEDVALARMGLPNADRAAAAAAAARGTGLTAAEMLMGANYAALRSAGTR